MIFATAKHFEEFAIKMEVYASDRAQAAQSHVRERRAPAELRMICCGKCAQQAAERAPYAAERARHDADPCAHGKRREVRTVCCGNAHDKLRTSFQFPIWPDMLTVRLPI